MSCLAWHKSTIRVVRFIVDILIGWRLSVHPKDKGLFQHSAQDQKSSEAVCWSPTEKQHTSALDQQNTPFTKWSAAFPSIYLSVGSCHRTGPRQGQWETLTRVGIQLMSFGWDHHFSADWASRVDETRSWVSRMSEHMNMNRVTVQKWPSFIKNR